MGKTAPIKQKGGTSIHSRAAKRASSPSIDTDKSLKDVQLPAATKIARPSVLAIHQGAGVTKKSKNGRKAVLSAKAKRRHEKGLDRAEAVMDKKEIKVSKSKDKARNVQDRARDWEELNKKMALRKAAQAQALKDAKAADADDGFEDMDEDEEAEPADEDSMVIEGDLAKSIHAPKVKAEAVAIPLPDEEEEL